MWPLAHEKRISVSVYCTRERERDVATVVDIYYSIDTNISLIHAAIRISKILSSDRQTETENNSEQ